MGVARHMIEQNAVSLDPVRELVRTIEIATDFLLVDCPLLPSHAGHYVSAYGWWRLHDEYDDLKRSQS